MDPKDRQFIDDNRMQATHVVERVAAMVTGRKHTVRAGGGSRDHDGHLYYKLFVDVGKVIITFNKDDETVRDISADFQSNNVGFWPAENAQAIWDAEKLF